MTKETVYTLIGVAAVTVVGLVLYDHMTRRAPQTYYEQGVLPAWGVGNYNQSGTTTWLDIVDNHLTDFMGLFN